MDFNEQLYCAALRAYAIGGRKDRISHDVGNERCEERGVTVTLSRQIAKRVDIWDHRDIQPQEVPIVA